MKDTHRPGHASALGLRADRDGLSIRSQTSEEIPMNRRRSLITVGITALLLGGLNPAMAMAQSVRGHGRVDGEISGQISVNAWLDDRNACHGYVIWTGPINPGDSYGTADPWLIKLNGLRFDRNNAYIDGSVAFSQFPDDIGRRVFFVFTDNSGTGEPDEINGIPIEDGNIIVRD